MPVLLIVTTRLRLDVFLLVVIKMMIKDVNHMLHGSRYF